MALHTRLFLLLARVCTHTQHHHLVSQKHLLFVSNRIGFITTHVCVPARRVRIAPPPASVVGHTHTHTAARRLYASFGRRLFTHTHTHARMLSFPPRSQAHKHTQTKAIIFRLQAATITKSPVCATHIPVVVAVHARLFTHSLQHTHTHHHHQHTHIIPQFVPIFVLPRHFSTGPIDREKDPYVYDRHSINKEYRQYQYDRQRRARRCFLINISISNK